MAAGDIKTFVVHVNDDGTALKNALTGQGIVVADSVSVSQIHHNRVVVVVVKAA